MGLLLQSGLPGSTSVRLSTTCGLQHERSECIRAWLRFYVSIEYLLTIDYSLTIDYYLTIVYYLTINHNLTIDYYLTISCLPGRLRTVQF